MWSYLYGKEGITVALKMYNKVFKILSLRAHSSDLCFILHSLGMCRLPLISHYCTNTAPKWTLNALFIYLLIFLSSSAGCQFCWWSILAEWTSVFLWVKMQPARLLLLDKPSEISQGPPTELSIKKEEEWHAVWVNVYNSELDTFR